jgi:hypothetical protein
MTVVPSLAERRPYRDRRHVGAWHEPRYALAAYAVKNMLPGMLSDEFAEWFAALAAPDAGEAATGPS